MSFGKRHQLIDEPRIDEGVSRRIELRPDCGGNMRPKLDGRDQSAQVIHGKWPNLAGVRAVKHEVAKPDVGLQQIVRRLQHARVRSCVAPAVTDSSAEISLPLLFDLGGTVGRGLPHQIFPIIRRPALSQHAAEEVVRIVTASRLAQRVLVVDPGINNNLRF
jgi:hypothetical protein